MRKQLLFFLPLLLWACGSKPSAEEAPLNVMTFNIRYDNPGDSLNGWSHRRDLVANAIRFYNPDLLGTQEVLHNQLQDLSERLPQYAYIGIGREDGKEKGEYCALWYKTERFEVEDSGYFWLSETPGTPGKGWDAACERTASWARMKDKQSGKRFLMMNTHIDHVGAVAQREGVRLLLSRADSLAKELPVIITGDFNSTPDSKVVQYLLKPLHSRPFTSAQALSPIAYGPNWSYHDFGKIPYSERPLIDYVFLRGDFKVLRYGVLAEQHNRTFISDHSPVFVTLH